MPKGSKADAGEKKMKAKGLPDHEVYAILNKEGLMHGNKTTAKGAVPDSHKSPASARIKGDHKGHKHG